MPLEDSFCCPSYFDILETGDHIFVACPRVARVWDWLSINILVGDKKNAMVYAWT
jgi:hypothetical protein